MSTSAGQPRKTQRVLGRVRLRSLVQIEEGRLQLTTRGERSVRKFMTLRGASG